MIKLQHVKKIYESNQTVALQDISLDIQTGEFITVVGPSGCGKTTLLNLLAGFEHPTEGKVTIEGELVAGPSPKCTIVFQQPTLLPWMNVEDNISFGLRLKKNKREIDHNRIAAFIQIMGLTGFENHKVYELSGGMQQRTAIARALITSPDIILMDEPFGALDAMTRSDLQQFLLNTWQQLRPTILFITHDIDEAILLGSRILVLTPRPGKLTKDISVDLPFPRALEVSTSDRFIQLKKEITQLLHPGNPVAPIQQIYQS